MVKRGATSGISGIDLHLELTGTRVRAALEQALRDAVRSGRLQPGARLPSSRALASDLGIGRNAVTDGYGQLIAEGWLVATAGSGTRVAARVVQEQTAHRSEPRADTARYDLSVGTPDLSHFPRAAWLKAARQALNTAPHTALGYGVIQGRLELREALADYLSRVRGVRTAADRIVICAGAGQALSLLYRVLHARALVRLAIEEVGEPSHRRFARDCGLQLQLLAVDDDGARVDQLTAADGGATADAVLLTPAHQFPVGAALAPQRRAEVVRWAVDHDALVIEDDYDGEFRFDRQPVGALQDLAPEHVAYVGTASKALAPGLRLAWLALPAALVDPVLELKTELDLASSSFDQLTLGQFIAGGGYDRHVRQSRVAYRRRRDQLLDALEPFKQHVRVAGLAAGLHAVIELPPQAPSAAVVQLAAERELIVEPFSWYLPPDGGPASGYSGRGNAIVVGYGTPSEHTFAATLARLRDVLGHYLEV
jgi:GntR family transcriptional regulator / MocR family aminotransferase